MRIVMLIARVILGAVFIYSGWQKLMGPVEEFRAVILQYAIFPKPFVPWIALLVPWLELIFGTFVVLGFMTRKSAVALACFLAVFITLLVRSLMLHLSIMECGCFGSGFLLRPRDAILLDVGLLIFAILVIRCKSDPWSLDARLNK